MAGTQDVNKVQYEHIVTGDQLHEKYKDKPMVFSWLGNYHYNCPNWYISQYFYNLMLLPNDLFGYTESPYCSPVVRGVLPTSLSVSSQNIWYQYVKSFMTIFKGNYRWIGVVNGLNEDGGVDVSFYCNYPVEQGQSYATMKIYGNNENKIGDTKITMGGFTILDSERLTKVVDPDTGQNLYYFVPPRFLTQRTGNPSSSGVFIYKRETSATNEPTFDLELEHSQFGALDNPKLFSDCSKTWRLGEGKAVPTLTELRNRPSLYFGKLGTEYVGQRIGIPRIVPTMMATDVKKQIGANKNYVSGNMYDLAQNFYFEKIYSKYLNRRVYTEGLQEPAQYWEDSPLYQSFNKNFAWGFIPYNIILTYSEDEAREFLDHGTIPSDAFVFDFDEADNFENNSPFVPTDGTPPSETDDTGDDEPGENGDNGRDTTPTPMHIPSITPQQLSNNNLYWLQSGQLETFITWFWTQAGEIIDIGDLWEKIIGQYADLVSAIINVRYMPIDASWVGGVLENDTIIISRISCSMPESYVIGKGKPIIRTIGSVDITHKYKTFCDYTPYSNLSLYLPYHGFIDLDVDLLMGYTLTIKAVYDIISGTIQYFIFCDDYIINTCIAKIAVDLPLTLQSKSDRDSAIFSNVMNATGNLIGAGVSAATGNPIGLVMSTSNAVQGGQSSAPLKLMATQGETGAFYAPQKCAIYVKFPSYNRPKNYKTMVGYPLNKQATLRDLTGYTVCYNPKINNFSHAAKPYDDEYTEICNLLKEGVYL